MPKSEVIKKQNSRTSNIFTCWACYFIKKKGKETSTNHPSKVKKGERGRNRKHYSHGPTLNRKPKYLTIGSLNSLNLAKINIFIMSMIIKHDKLEWLMTKDDARHVCNKRCSMKSSPHYNQHNNLHNMYSGVHNTILTLILQYLSYTIVSRASLWHQPSNPQYLRTMNPW